MRGEQRCRGVAAVAAVGLLAWSVVGCSGSGPPGSGSSGSGSARTARDASPGRARGSRSANPPPTGSISPWDWPTYGHDAQHSFHGRTTLTAATASQLTQAWAFPTGDAVTATPTVVHGTVYVGSWDGFFYALDLRTGRLRWKFALHRQHAIQPHPGEQPRDATSDGGMVTSSAWFEPGDGHRPDLVLFGGGYTLYALDAATGRPFWFHDYTGRPDKAPDPDHDEARIFSSPVVVAGKVIVGVSTDGQNHHRGYVVAARLSDGEPAWTHETNVDVSGTVANDGCGNVWSSATVLPRQGLVAVAVADCKFSNLPPDSETVLALRVADGTMAWRFRPPRLDDKCDFDFGASVNAGLDRDGSASFLGVGAKDGTYYALDPRTGILRWSTNVVFGGFAGGFIATTAYDGQRVYGSTALGDFGRFESNGPQVCAPGNPTDRPFQEPTVHALDGRTGKVIWQAEGAPSFGPTTVAGDLTFNGTALTDKVLVREASSGRVVKEIVVAAPCWSGVATVGDAVVFGTGASHQGTSAGVFAYAPGGRSPTVPTG